MGALDRLLSLFQTVCSRLWWLLVALSAFFLAGGIYDLTERRLIVGPVTIEGRLYFVYPLSGEQFLIESLAAMALLGMTLLGFLLIAETSKRIYRPREAQLALVSGTMLIAIASLGLWLLAQLKT